MVSPSEPQVPHPSSQEGQGGRYQLRFSVIVTSEKGRRGEPGQDTEWERGGGRKRERKREEGNRQGRGVKVKGAK